MRVFLSRCRRLPSDIMKFVREIRKGLAAQAQQEHTLRHYELPWKIRLPLIASAAAIGVIVYSIWFVDGRYETVFESYRSANVIHELFKEDATLSHELELNSTLFARWLTLANMTEEQVDTTLFTADGGADYSYLGSILFPTGGTPVPRTPGELKTVELLVYIAQQMGNATSGDMSSEDFREVASTELAASLAGVPGKRFALFKPSFGELWHEGLQEALAGEASLSSMLDPEFDGTPGNLTLRFMPIPPLRDPRQLELLYHRTSVVGATGLAGDLAELADDPLGAEQFDFVNRFSLELISRLHAHPEVKRAKRWQTLFLGPEQCLMLIVALAMLMAMAVRSVHRILQADEVADLEVKLRGLNLQTATLEDLKTVLLERSKADSVREVESDTLPRAHDQKTIPGYFAAMGLLSSERPDDPEDANAGGSLAALTDLEKSRIHNSRWPIRYAARALPALGFVGTVRGILFALSDADSIVRATNQASQAAAVASVSSTLGLAFGTTLIALVLGLVLGVMNDSQTAREFETVDRVEEALLPAWSRFLS